METVKVGGVQAALKNNAPEEDKTNKVSVIKKEEETPVPVEEKPKINLKVPEEGTGIKFSADAESKLFANSNVQFKSVNFADGDE